MIEWAEWVMAAYTVCLKAPLRHITHSIWMIGPFRTTVRIIPDTVCQCTYIHDTMSREDVVVLPTDTIRVYSLLLFWLAAVIMKHVQIAMVWCRQFLSTSSCSITWYFMLVLNRYPGFFLFVFLRKLLDTFLSQSIALNIWPIVLSNSVGICGGVISYKIV